MTFILLREESRQEEGIIFIPHIICKEKIVSVNVNTNNTKEFRIDFDNDTYLTLKNICVEDLLSFEKELNIKPFILTN